MKKVKEQIRERNLTPLRHKVIVRMLPDSASDHALSPGVWCVRFVSFLCYFNSSYQLPAQKVCIRNCCVIVRSSVCSLHRYLNFYYIAVLKTVALSRDISTLGYDFSTHIFLGHDITLQNDVVSATPGSLFLSTSRRSQAQFFLPHI